MHTNSSHINIHFSLKENSKTRGQSEKRSPTEDLERSVNSKGWKETVSVTDGKVQSTTAERSCLSRQRAAGQAGEATNHG